MANNGLVLPPFDLLNSHARSVQELTAPLRKLGITLFSHTRVYADNTFIDISDRADMLDYFYYQSDIYKYYYPDVDPWSIDKKFFLCSAMEGNPSIIGLRDDLNIDNIIVLRQQFKTHCELWHFGSAAYNHEILNFYLNNLDVLQSFAMFFNEAASYIIKDCENNRIKRPPDVNEYFLNAAKTDLVNKKDFYALIGKDGLNLIYKNTNIKLSKREIEILKWCIFGKSSQEIALILGISGRTIENHIANVKNKLECRKITDILRILVETGVAEIILKFE